MTTQPSEALAEIQRSYLDFASPRGLRTDILPWRLWENAKKLMWDPADIDFSRDAQDWRNLTDEQQYQIAGLARGFMVGEEGVTLDIMPLALAICDEGRFEEAMFLTTFAFEEAKHVDFFRRWFDAVGFDLQEMDRILRERAREQGRSVPEPDEPREGLFEKELPKVMRRVLTDRSPEAYLDCGVTYNQFVEGCLAIAGYRVWGRMFERFGVLPGMQEGLKYVQRDERRHIAYGTYLCRRLIAANPDLFEFARDRMHELSAGYYQQQQARNTSGGGGDGQGDGQGDGYGGNGGGPMSLFREQMLAQVERRIAVLDRARSLSPEEAEQGSGAQEAEVELEHD